MLWFFILITVVPVVLVSIAGVLASRKKLTREVIYALVGIGLLIVATGLLWKHLIVALAIAAVCSLAVFVMFGRVAPSKAIMGAATAFVLFFVFAWLALQIANPLLFHRESDLSLWLKGTMEQSQLPAGYHMGTSGFLIALGVACLVGGSFLARPMKAIPLSISALLLMIGLPMALAEQGFSFRELFNNADPWFRLASLGVIVGGAVAVTAMMALNLRKP